MEIISAAIGLTLTLMVFSYLMGDNPLFRVAVYIFIGVASGYAATVVVYYVFVPRLANLLQTNDLYQFILTAIPLLLGVSLLAKFFPRTSWMGNFAMALLVGVGAAAAIGGALLGTVVPQLLAAIDAFDLRSAADFGARISKFGEGVVMFLGTVLTLAAFHFSAGAAPKTLIS
jgi:hypothetical protein